MIGGLAFLLVSGAVVVALACWYWKVIRRGRRLASRQKVRVIYYRLKSEPNDLSVVLPVRTGSAVEDVMSLKDLFALESSGSISVVALKHKGHPWRDSVEISRSTSMFMHIDMCTVHPPEVLHEWMEASAEESTALRELVSHEAFRPFESAFVRLYELNRRLGRHRPGGPQGGIVASLYLAVASLIKSASLSSSSSGEE